MFLALTWKYLKRKQSLKMMLPSAVINSFEVALTSILARYCSLDSGRLKVRKKNSPYRVAIF